MDGDTDTYFDDLRMTTKPLTSREWFDEGIKYAQRLQKEQKQEWIEMDELMMKAVIGILDERDHPKLCFWLKSLRPSWKPSEMNTNCQGCLYWTGKCKLPKGLQCPERKEEKK